MPSSIHVLYAIGIRRPTPKAPVVTFNPSAACLRLYSLRSTRRCVRIGDLLLDLLFERLRVGFVDDFGRPPGLLDWPGPEALTVGKAPRIAQSRCGAQFDCEENILKLPDDSQSRLRVRTVHRLSGTYLSPCNPRRPRGHDCIPANIAETLRFFLTSVLKRLSSPRYIDGCYS
jgi:hypothetical protein